MRINLPVSITGNFTYVDCGAVGDGSKPLLKNFKDVRYIGFDPSMNDILVTNDKCMYFPVAVAKESAQMDFNFTNNPNCSSFLSPNYDFLNDFMEVDNFFKIIDTISLKTVALDEYLPFQGVKDVDFIELDTQGSELSILQGALQLLSSNIVGVRVEVEFAEIYKNQPLFGDIDMFLRQFDFKLFDIERYRLRRKSYPTGIDSREQIVWGQALYLRDFRSLLKNQNVAKEKLSKLAIVAAHYGFYSYAIDIVNCLTQTDGLINAVEKKELEKEFFRSLSNLRESPYLKWAYFLVKPPVGKFFRKWWKSITKFYEACRFVIDRQKYFWKD